MKGVSLLENQILKLLSVFHQASKLAIFVLNSTLQVTNKFTLAVTPNFPNNYIKRLNIINVAPSAKVFTTSEDECFSVITTTNSAQKFIVIWVNTRTLEQTGYYQDHFPSIGVDRLIAYTKSLYFTLFQDFPSLTEPEFVSDSNFISDSKHDLNIYNRQQEHIYHNSYFKEQLMLKAVEHANLDEYNQALTAFIKSGSYGQMSATQELRNKKDIVIAGTTLTTRAAIKGGLSPESAFALSDKCCQRIENLSNIVSVSNLMQEIGSLFIARMRSNEGGAEYSIVFKIQDYIYRQQYNHLNLTSLAENLGYSKNYLCKSFKRATGKTIIQYANGQRIQEAESRLVFSNKSIATIADELGFNDQSYFTKLFFQYKQTTPQKFRQKFHL